MQGIKHILLHLQGEESDTRCSDFAVALARRLDAAVSTLFVRVPPAVPPFTLGPFRRGIEQAQTEYFKKREAVARAAFASLEKKLGTTPEWNALEGHRIDSLVHFGHCFDLVVVAQEEQRTGSMIVDFDQPAEVVLAVGRPVLIVPARADIASIGSRIALAWKGSRESARALGDALPLLQLADEVAVVVVVTGDEQSTKDSGAERVVGHLADRGINARLETRTAGTRNEAGKALLAAVADAKADLLVSGAYGQSRWRQFIVGSVTRELLRNADVPLLLAH
jgi:nucleotide-binding universal stress UspA family protein